MSRRFVESFFPSTTALLRHFVPDTVQRYFPDDLDDRPALAVWIVLGVGVGLYGWGVMMIRTTTTLPSSSGCWSAAFGLFGAMNVVALPLHCLLPRHEQSSTAYPILWMLDCVFTGMSSLFLTRGSLGLLMRHYPQKGTSHNTDWIRLLREPERVTRFGHAFLVIALLASHFMDLSVVQLLNANDEVDADNSTVNSGEWWKEPLWIECTYLGPLVGSFIACPPAIWGTLWRAWQSQQPVGRLLGSVAVMAMGLVLGALGVTQVPWLCGVFPTELWWDLFSAPALVFAGCDVAFLGLAWWLRIVSYEAQVPADRSPTNQEGQSSKPKIS